MSNRMEINFMNGVAMALAKHGWITGKKNDHSRWYKMVAGYKYDTGYDYYFYTEETDIFYTKVKTDDGLNYIFASLTSKGNVIKTNNITGIYRDITWRTSNARVSEFYYSQGSLPYNIDTDEYYKTESDALKDFRAEIQGHGEPAWVYPANRWIKLTAGVIYPYANDGSGFYVDYNDIYCTRVKINYTNGYGTKYRIWFASWTKYYGSVVHSTRSGVNRSIDVGKYNYDSKLFYISSNDLDPPQDYMYDYEYTFDDDAGYYKIIRSFGT